MDVNENTTANHRASPSKNEQLALFAKNFFKHPKMLGSIIPSSPFLVRRMLESVNWQQAGVLIEYGPGIGTFTQEILRRMHPDAVLIAIETNEDFVDYLRRAYPDPRLQIVHDSAENIQQVLADNELGRADYVIAGIPFSTLPNELKERILCSTQQALEPDGNFLLYQFSPKILPHLQEAFSYVKKSFVPLNFLPAHFYCCIP